MHERRAGEGESEMNSIRRFVLILSLAVLSGCGHPGKDGKLYTDTPQGRTARYVHEKCYFRAYFPAMQWWNTAEGKMMMEKAGTLYTCPDSPVVIRDDEEQP